MIVGITGLKRSGKDTLAEVLVKDFNFFRYGLADPLKKAVKVMFDWDSEWTDGKYKEKIDPRWGISPRQALQHLGTDWGQYALCEDYPQFKETTGRKLWINNFLYWYENLNNAFDTIEVDAVISDIRFPHEIEAIQNFPMDIRKVFIRVERPSINNKDRHESEIHIDNLSVDYVLYNKESSVEEFIANKKPILEKISKLKWEIKE